MSKRFLIGMFEHEEATLAAVRSSRRLGLKIVDVHSPYAVHGLDEAMGLRPSRLPWLVFFLGLTGATLKLWFQIWTMGVDWPLNVGGKPLFAWPAYVPVTFEVTVLFAGVGGVVAFFLVSRLYPGKKAVLPDVRVTDDRFAVILEQTDAAFDAARVRELLLASGAVAVEERVQGGRR